MAKNKINYNQASASDQQSQLQKLRDYCARFAYQKGREPTYFIRTFGCQQNENDSEIIAGTLEAAGFSVCDSYEEADLTVLNTCSIRENADDRLFGHLGILKTLQSRDPQRMTLLCGCMMTQDQHVAKVRKSFRFVDLIFGPHDLHRLPELLWQSLNSGRLLVSVADEKVIVDNLPIARQRQFRALVSIMYGCTNFCTYCIVPYARGREKSRSCDSILTEIRQLVDDGYSEVMLLGQNVNAWGKDLPIESFRTGEPQRFADLLAAIAQIPGLRRIRYMSSHPRDFSDELIAVIGHYLNIEPHVHLPLQSGSDRVLKRMNRHYDRAHFLSVANKLKAARPGINLTTDIIVGFPGETEDDFEQTLETMREVRFGSAFTFIYSAREGTPAASFPDQIPAEVTSARFERLVALQNEHSLDFHRRSLGQIEEVLFEGISHGDEQVLTGRTADFKLVNIRIPDEYKVTLPAQAFDLQGKPDGQFFEGRFAQVRLDEARTFSVEGTMIQLL